MKQQTNFGYKFLLCLVAIGAIMHAAARGFHFPSDYDPDPKPDSPATNIDSPQLHFPIHDRVGDPLNDKGSSTIDLKDPSNVKKTIDYDPENQRYYITEKIGNEYYRSPTYMTLGEYLKYQGQNDEQAYWKRRMDALTLFNKKPTLPTMYKEGLFDRIFGGTSIQVRPQGNVDVTIGGNWQHIKNPTLVQRAQKYGVFDFDMQMNINLLATIGDKMKLNISNNTKATFDYQNMQRLEYTGKEDEIIKKIEAGNISFPLRSSLITGVQSLFGLKTQLQFGKLWITAAVSQQKSKRQSLTIQGGSQTQTFAIKADEYEENKHFLLGQYFHDNYNEALKKFPVLTSLVTINRLEVWVTNRTGAVDGVRDVLGFMDLGEKSPYRQNLVGSTVAGNAPTDNRSNQLYNQLLQNPDMRTNPTATLLGLGLQQGIDFEKATARKLNTSEYSFNPQLGYISLNTTLNPDDILAVAYRYTFNGKTYQVGEFAEDLPPDSSHTKAMFMKLLKGTASRPTLPVWRLMMKNVYALGGMGVSKDDFRLNVLYQNPGGGEIRYLPEGPYKGVPLLTLLNLDRLNFQNDPQPDGIFDFVEGLTINTQQGKIMFPLLEPFGRDLNFAVGGQPQLERKYLYTILYDSTKTIARQFQQQNRYVIRGTYRSASSSEIFLGGFNIPQGSVTVTAGGQRLVEGADYQIDYGIGRLKILNMGILNSGMPINVQYEDNATFGFQQQNFMGARLDYYLNPKLSLGGTFMRLKERPFTQKTTFGEDPIKNTVLGLDANYQTEAPGLSRLLDKLPIYSTTASSFITASGEAATILPGHPKQINALDPEGSVYIDDFEGTRSGIDMRLPAQSWSLSSVPVNAINQSGAELFPEGKLLDNLDYGKNRGRLAWYTIEPSLVDAIGGIPDYVKKDPNQHYIRLVQQQDVFPTKSQQTLQNGLTTFDLGFYPRERGPYNFDTHLNQDGTLPNPKARFGGIQRAIDYSDFEQSNVQFLEFWIMDPFIYNKNTNGGQLYINLGNVSEDVIKDSKKFFENGIPYPKDPNKLQSSVWGFTPTLQTQIVRAFDNDPAARAVQDVGYDGLDDNEEQAKFAAFLNTINVAPGVLSDIQSDPSNDNYRYFRASEYDQQNAGILQRYKRFNNSQGNSPITTNTQTYSNAATNIPESEDINRDNTLNESEDYYQYSVDIVPGKMKVGTNYIVNSSTQNVKLPNGNYESETWYQFKIPIRDGKRIGNISDFRSIRFMRMFLTGFEDSTNLRFARLELGRNQWRSYQFSLQSPGEVIPDKDLQTTSFAVTSVSVEENSGRTPIPYVVPPGVDRQLAQVSNGASIQLNEQSLSLQVCGLQDGDARAVYKEVGVDMRQFGKLKMFLHAESQVNQAPIKDGDIRAIVRIGSDFTNNYYEYQIPLTVSPNGSNRQTDVWPEKNNMELTLSDLVETKTERHSKGLPSYVPYSRQDSKGNTIVVVGNPNIGDAKTILLGILNPKKTNATPADDGLPKCAEVWFNELRMTGLNEKPGYAATGKVNVQLADLGNVKLSGSMHTQGYGSIDQKLNQRSRDNFYQYDASTNLNMGKLMPRNWGVQLPLFVGYTQSVSNPQYDPYDLDVKYKSELSAARDKAERDSLKKVAQDFSSITSVNLSNVRILGNPEKQNTKPKPWDSKNFDLSYAYNRQFKRNPTIQGDELTNHRLNLGYTYSLKSKPIEPFKKLIKSRSKWLGLVKDFNFTPLPTNFTFRTELNKIMDETKVRSVGEGAMDIAPTYYKNFTWLRDYNLRWELTRSLSFDYHATNRSRIDEPYGRANTADKRDTLWNRFKTFGRNTGYNQTFASSYKLPTSKLPLVDWTNANITYSSSYTYTAASLLAKSLGNTVANTQGIQTTGELDFKSLYNKQRWLRAVNMPKNRQPKALKNALRGNNSPRDKNDASPTGDMMDRNNDVRNEKEADAIGGRKKDRGGDDVVSKQKKEKADQEKPTTDETKALQAGKNAPILIAGVDISNMSDHQIDSLRKIQKAQDAAQKKAEKEKRKKERIAKRKARRNSIPDISEGERIAGRLLTMLKRITFTYGQQSGTILPGYMDSTRYVGINNLNGQPGLGFAFGYQPGRPWLEQKGLDGKLSHDSLYNSQFQQQYSRNLSIQATVEPIPDLRVDLTWQQTFSKTHSELFKDTGTGFHHLSPYESGSFNITTIALKTMFQASGPGSGPFQQFLDNRPTISRRLGSSNPYTNGTLDPNDPNYTKGYTRYSQDVMVPAFIAAYTGKSAENVALVDYSNSENMKHNPFQYYYPMPNWRMSYNGLNKIPWIQERVSNLVISNAYDARMTMNSFTSSLFYLDAYNLGYPSFIDSNSGNYIPYFQVPNITITEQFGPLLGIDAALRNNLSLRFEYRKARTASLSLIDYQVSETKSTDYTFGLGYRVRGVKLPIEILGVRKLKNDLNVKMDIGVREDRTTNNYLAQNTSITSRGQRVITISPSIDYIVNERLTIRLFYDRRQTIPFVSSSFPMTTTRAGITLRFIFAQ
ncbi:MAG: cell surface protein SprA [Bacteroidetes bacterium]|nr:cell surface protein SprA [Bacteroidota bacterium]